MQIYTIKYRRRKDRKNWPEEKTNFFYKNKSKLNVILTETSNSISRCRHYFPF